MDYDTFDSVKGDKCYAETSDVSAGTTACLAYELYIAKRKQIDNLDYECKLLVDKYHREMLNANIPLQFSQDIISDMFNKDEKAVSNAARTHFIKLCFSAGFLAAHQVSFVELRWQGYDKTYADIVLDIGDCDYYYSVEIPFPKNIKDDKKKASLMGKVKFRADRIKKSKWNEFMKEWEAVQMPTYDWKKCFKAIEADVAIEGK